MAPQLFSDTTFQCIYTEGTAFVYETTFYSLQGTEPEGCSVQVQCAYDRMDYTKRSD